MKWEACVRWEGLVCSGRGLCGIQRGGLCEELV